MALPLPTQASLGVRLKDLAAAFPLRKIALVGDLVADHYLYGQTERISREAPVLIIRHESAEVKLGGGANAAANVRSLGGQVIAVGAVGKDEMGRTLKGLFRDAKIRLWSPVSDALVTETKTRILAGGINTTRQQMLRVDRGGKGTLPAPIRVELARLIERAAASVEAILVSDYGSGVVCDEVKASLRKLAADGMPVCVDSRFALGSFTQMTYCKPNEPELAALTGRELRSEKDLIEAGRAALKQLRCQALVVTRGKNGMVVFTKGGQAEMIPVHGAKEAVDVTGAGDTVMAAFTLGVSAGAGPIEAAYLANVAGALVVQKQGTATVGHDELVAELKLLDAEAAP